MNILFRDGSDRGHVAIINKIRETINPELSLIICEPSAKDYLELNSNEIILDYYNVLEGKHDDCINLPPIDEQVLLGLNPYYSEIMKSISRNGSYYHSYPKREELFKRIVRYWNWALDEYKIDLFLGFAVPHFGYELIIYYLCKIKSVKTLFTWHTSIHPYMHFVEDIDKIGEEVNEPHKYFNEQCNGTGENYTEDSIELDEDFQTHLNMHIEKSPDRTPFYMKFSKIDKFKAKLTGFMSYYKYLHENKKSLWGAVLLKFFRLIDNGDYIGNYKKNTVEINYSKNEKYIYVPLHLQPEATTCPLGGGILRSAFDDKYAILLFAQGSLFVC